MHVYVCDTNHSGTLHGVADDHNDTSSVVLEDTCCGTLTQLTIRTEHGVEGNADTARNVASTEAGGRGVKEYSSE